MSGYGRPPVQARTRAPRRTDRRLHAARDSPATPHDAAAARLRRSVSGMPSYSGRAGPVAGTSGGEPVLLRDGDDGGGPARQARLPASLARAFTAALWATSLHRTSRTAAPHWSAPAPHPARAATHRPPRAGRDRSATTEPRGGGMNVEAIADSTVPMRRYVAPTASATRRASPEFSEPGARRTPQGGGKAAPGAPVYRAAACRTRSFSLLTRPDDMSLCIVRSRERRGSQGCSCTPGWPGQAAGGHQPPPGGA